MLLAEVPQLNCREIRERLHRVLHVLADRDQVGLVRDITQCRLVDRSPGQHESDRDCEPDAKRDNQDDRLEEPRAQTRHAAWSLYPAPRTVRMESGSPSLRRNCATCTSTVRVPP